MIARVCDEWKNDACTMMALVFCKSICIAEPEINERRPATEDEFPISK